jgi:hypothetical protein
MLLTRIDLLDDLLQQHEDAIGIDFTAYRNHAYRVLNFCTALAPAQPERSAKLAIAAAFHDLGIWTARTFDYLPPSEALARDYLESQNLQHWCDEVIGMIAQHHKITRCPPGTPVLVEVFRRADWVDVSHGLLTYGLPRPLLREVFAAFPDAGFHKRLLQLSAKRLFTHPLNPLPMMRR